MAAAFFNQLADPNRAIALSAGTAPAAHVHLMAVVAMHEVGVDLAKAKPQLLTTALVRDVTLLVTMGCGDACPFVPGVEILDWQLDDPKDRPLEEVRTIRDEIRLRVDRLVQVRGWNAGPPTVN
jgi:arsenate reductase